MVKSSTGVTHLGLESSVVAAFDPDYIFEEHDERFENIGVDDFATLFKNGKYHFIWIH